MTRLPFEMVDRLVSIFDDTHTTETITDQYVEDRCLAMADLLNSLGWSEDEYWEEWLKRTEELDFDVEPPYTTSEKIILN